MTREATTELTLDDIRAAILRYSDKFGMARALLDIKDIVGCRIDEMQTQADLQMAIDKIDGCIENSPDVLSFDEVFRTWEDPDGTVHLAFIGGRSPEELAELAARKEEGLPSEAEFESLTTD